MLMKCMEDDEGEREQEEGTYSHSRMLSYALRDRNR